MCSSSEEDRPFLDATKPRRSKLDHHKPSFWTKITGRPVNPWSSPLLCAFIATTLSSLFWGALLITLQNQSRSCHYHNSSAANLTTTTAIDHHTHQPGKIESGANFKLHASNYLHCGKSVAESKKLGCKYDILSNHFVPALCMDAASVQMYQKMDGDSWFGYVDMNRTRRLDSTEAMGDVAGGVYYTNMRDHIVHCAALWKKQFKAFFEERVYYDSLILDPHHTNHCADFLVDMTDRGGVDFKGIAIQVEVGHAGCWVRD